MNFSAFEDDQTLGNTGGRIVVLRGTTTVSQLFSPNLFPISQWIQTGLENRGFIVNAVRMSAAGWIGYANNIELELYVYNEHTAEQARVNAIRAIEDYRANFGFNQVFSNTTLDVVSDAYVPPGDPGYIHNGGNVGTVTVSGGWGNAQNPPSAYNQSNQQQGGGGSNFLDNLGLGLGVSTPIVIGAGALLLLLVLKK
jgi:hypothetical protein